MISRSTDPGPDRLYSPDSGSPAVVRPAVPLSRHLIFGQHAASSGLAPVPLSLADPFSMKALAPADVLRPFRASDGVELEVGLHTQPGRSWLRFLSGSWISEMNLTWMRRDLKLDQLISSTPEGRRCLSVSGGGHVDSQVLFCVCVLFFLACLQTCDVTSVFQLVSVVLLVLAPLSTSAILVTSTDPALPADCNDIHRHDNSRPSGVYTIYPIGATSAVQVFCDMDSQGGRWTVFQRRIDGSLNFYRPWSQYRTGFGNAAGEYWLGLEVLHHLTIRANELLVQMEDFDGKEAFARYSSFSVGAESDGYRLNVSGFIDGGAGEFTPSDAHMRTSHFGFPAP
ncbi:uncharacterized protein LOC121964505 [Plectropomus leopardus]|uniref:uncharacterized protein LOC121964505 n=1 Tax=Plectropomus leopardus TaxID=160734 RepID=UPI001C4C16F0|nr:uncharacterized protein LOC121964505 [Plectropomus leopardus]